MANEQALRKLTRARAALSGAALRDANLTRANLSNADLRDAGRIHPGQLLLFASAGIGFAWGVTLARA